MKTIEKYEFIAPFSRETQKKLAQRQKQQEQLEQQQAQEIRSRQAFVMSIVALAQQEQAQYETAMQGVIDATARVQKSLNSGSGSKNIADLIRNLRDLNEAKKTVENYGMPSGMDSQYEKILQLMTQNIQQINKYKEKLNETKKSSEKAGT